MNWISFAVGAALAVVIAWLAHTVVVDRLIRKQETAIADQQAADTKTCKTAQTITKEANDALQKDRDAINARLNALLVQHPSTCILPVSKPSKLPSSKPVKHAGSHGAGVSTDWLRSFAAECEGYRRELNTCIDFTHHLPQK